MLIQCPNCQTTYKVSDEVLKGTTPAFRCSRCKHTFELEGDDSPRDLPEVTHLSEAAVAREVFRRRGAELPFAPKPERPTPTSSGPVIVNESIETRLG